MIIWDEKKNEKLKIERNISFELISEIILNKGYTDILQHSKRKNQFIFIVEIDKYFFAVPFIIDRHNNIVLKTAYPSRKINKKYRGQP